MRVVIISQARMTSTRLPGKVLKEVLGKPLLEYQIERLKKVVLADEVVIATSENQSDNPIVNLCKKMRVKYYRGSENDVLERYYKTALEYRADAVVRVTADCPFIDPLIIDRVIDSFIKTCDQYDYVSNVIERTFPRGMDTEVFSMQVLEKAFFEAKSQAEREHVTLFIHNHSQLFRLANIRHSQDLSHLRWTVDESEDFKLIQLILEALYPGTPDFSMEDILNLLEQHPELKRINAHIEQKKIMDGDEAK